MKTAPSPIAPLFLIESREIGSNVGRGNLLGIQPYMVMKDYRNEETFTTKMRGYFQEARAKGFINPKTVVVLPEYAATWLVAVEEKDAIYACKTVEGAMVGLILGNFRKFLHASFSQFKNQRARDRFKYSLFRMKAETAARIYFNSFSQLASEFGVTIVAGSIVLPRLRVREDGSGVDVTGDELYNTTLVFNPDGRADPRPFLKIYPTPQELPFTTPGTEDDLPVYPTPAGRLGMLNCADSWYATPYEKLRGKIDFLAVPSFIEKDGDLAKPWSGKNITPTPPEFDPKDYQRITYDEAWVKYASPARFQGADVRHVMNVFLRGRFWSLGSDGYSIILNGGKLERGQMGTGAALQSLWLN